MSNQLAVLDREYQSTLDALSTLQKSREWELMKSAADAAGILDPTPTSDVVSGIMSAVEGDVVGVLLSAVSIIPWIGDAVGKPAKAARLAEKLSGLEASFAKTVKKLDSLSDPLKRYEEAAKRVREAKRSAVGSVQECTRLGKWGTDLPATGSWAGTRGNSRWTSEDGSYTVPYKEGYPDFTKASGPAGDPIVRDTVRIPMTGKNHKDFKEADTHMKAKYGESFDRSGYTWHHAEDGVSMVLVRSDVHDKTLLHKDGRTGSGAAHDGGASIVKSEEF